MKPTSTGARLSRSMDLGQCLSLNCNTLGLAQTTCRHARVTPVWYRSVPGSMRKMATSLISRKWMNLGIGKNGYERVLHIETEVICNPKAADYDQRSETALVKEANAFLTSGVCDKIVVHGAEIDDATRP